MAGEQQPISAPVLEVVDTPAPDVSTSEIVDTGTTEQAAETDEQKNERLLKEREERSRKRADTINRRFGELTSEKRELMEQNRRLMQLLEQRAEKPLQSDARNDGGPPKREQYDSWEAWNRADAAYAARQEARQELMQFMNAVRTHEQQQRARSQVAEISQRYEQSVAKARAEIPDWESVVSNLDVDAPPSMFKAIFESDNPGAVAYQLGLNKAEAQRIARLPPEQQIRAIGRLEAGIAAAASAPRVSKAPPPGKPVGSSSAPVNKDVKQMTRDEYYAHITRDRRR